MTAWVRAAKPIGWFPRRGEVCLVLLDKERPALIISADAVTKYSLDVCVIPISKVQHRQFSLRPKLDKGGAGLNYDSWLKCDQPTTIEKIDVLYPPLGQLSAAKLTAVENCIKTALQLK
jgi:mRNA-degrading endonuclease toxin of MazEF toxin-antitoxin module